MTTTLPILEHWLPVPGCKTVLISSAGRVYDTVASNYLTPRGEEEYATVTLVDDLGRTYQRNLARTVVSVFGHSPRLGDEPRDPIFVPPAPVTESEDPDGVVTDIAWRAVTLPDVVEGYQVSELGEMLSPNGNILSPSEVGLSGKSPKLVLSLARPAGTDYSGRAMVRLDDVVAQAFLPPRPSERYFPEHINGDWRDCRVENLRWAKIPRQTHQKGKPGKAKSRKEVIYKITKNPDFRPVVTEGVAPGRFWVSRKGEVVGLNGNPLRRHNRNGVQLRTERGDGNTTRQVARLVMDAFAGPPPTADHQIMFRDGNPSHCALDNLFWGLPDTAPTPPTRNDAVEVITTTVYRYGGVEVTSYPGGRWEHPPMTPTNAAALARIFEEIGQRTVGE